VDPVGRRDIRQILIQLRQRGKTVFVNSHLLSELEMICDRVAILLRGQIVKQGTIDELTQEQQWYELELDDAAAAIRAALLTAFPGSFTAAPAVPVGAMAAGPPPLPIERGALPSGQWLQLDRNLLRVGTTEPKEVQAVIDALRRTGMIIRRLQLRRPSLEELFMDAVLAGDANP
jgi:ABC-type multidrug transport system ATPase subunit